MIALKNPLEIGVSQCQHNNENVCVCACMHIYTYMWPFVLPFYGANVVNIKEFQTLICPIYSKWSSQYIYNII